MRVVTAHLKGVSLHVRTIGILLMGVEMNRLFVYLVEVRLFLAVLQSILD